MKSKKSTPTGETKLHPKNPNETIMLYDDGAWRYDGNGEKTKGALAIKPAWLTTFNKETALAANEVKKDKRKEAFMRGIVAGAKGLSPRPINNSDEAFEYLVEVRTEVALSGDSGSLGDAKWIDEALHGDRKNKEDVPKIEIKVDGAFIQAIQHVRDRHEIEEDTTIEGDFVDSD